MEKEIVKLDHGKITLPEVVQESLHIKQGDELIVTVSNQMILIKRKDNEEDFSDLLKLSESVARKLWDNEEDEVWNNV